MLARLFADLLAKKAGNSPAVTASHSRTDGVQALNSCLNVQLNRKALIVTFQHPYGATEMMAASLAAALQLSGYSTEIAIVGSPNFGQRLNVLLDADLELVIVTGSPPLDIVVNDNRYLWQIVASHVTFVTLIVDAIPYDFRLLGFSAFLNDFPKFSNLVILCFENNIAEILTRYTGKKAYYMPTGANLVPPLQEKPRHPDRLMFWGTVGAELLRSDYTSDLFEVIRNNNAWGLSEREIQRVGVAVMESGQSYGLFALSDALDMPVEVMLERTWINELCAIDSAIKRYRRTFLIKSLSDYPIDIYGKNWESYVSTSKNIRLMECAPDHNLAFGYVCQHYAGVLNIDPNWGDGTNERAVTALSMGVRLATNNNKRVENVAGCYMYGLTRESIRAASTEALTGAKPNAPLSELTWEYLLGKFLRELRDDYKPP